MKKLMLIIVLLFSFVGFSQRVRFEETQKRFTVMETIPKQPEVNIASDFKNFSPEERKQQTIPFAKLYRDFYLAELAERDPMKAGAISFMKLDEFPVDLVCIITEKKISNNSYLYQFRPNPGLYNNNQSEDFKEVMKGMSTFDIVVNTSPGVFDIRLFSFKGKTRYLDSAFSLKMDVYKVENQMSFNKILLPKHK